MRRLAAIALALVIVASCGPKVPPVAPGAPPYQHYPDYLFPTPAAASPAADRAGQREAWDTLQAGNVGSAERQLNELLKRAPADASILASLGYVALAKRDADRAVGRFNDAIAKQPALAPALVGRGLAFAELGRPADALASFEAAHAADPSLDLAARIDALRFRAVEDTVARARTDGSGGKLEAARQEYQAALQLSPDSGVLLRELAGVERQLNDRPSARHHLERAMQVDPTDHAARIQYADLLEDQGDLSGAAKALEAAQAIERSADVESRLATLRERTDLAGLPPEFRAIENSPTVTRAQVAALLGIRLPALLRAAPKRPAALVTDIGGQWAAPWISSVLDAGVMEAYPNHTFQPQGQVRRADFAAIVSRTLALASVLDPPRAKNWQRDHVSFSDLQPSHPAFDAASRAVGARVLTTTADGAFEPTRPVTGAEAGEAVARLQKLIGPRPGDKRP
jgi:tetratricopeptide (TPR) repeat protein